MLEHLAMRDSAGTLTFLHADHLSGTAATSSGVAAGGSQTSKQKYYAYGSIRTTVGTVPTPYEFTGERLDASTSLHYYGARYYDPVVGVFVQPDTIVAQPGNPQSLNRYAYVNNNPLRYVDPSGQDPLDQNWIDAWRAAQGGACQANPACQPSDIDRQQRLYSLMFRGSVSHSANWTDEDWKAFNDEGTKNVFEKTDGRESLSDFADAVDRLSEYYQWNEQAQFVGAIALIFAGVAYHPGNYLAFWQTATTPGPVQYSYVAFGMAGWNPQYVERNQKGDLIENTHHYAGHLLAGYFILGANAPLTVARELRSAGWNPLDVSWPDVQLGALAGAHGSAMRILPPQLLGSLIRFWLHYAAKSQVPPVSYTW